MILLQRIILGKEQTHHNRALYNTLSQLIDQFKKQVQCFVQYAMAMHAYIYKL